MLTALGFYHGPINGIFGPLTKAAVKRFQAAHGIPQTGYVGPKTRAALNQGSAPTMADEQKSLMLKSLQDQLAVLMAKLKALLGQ